LKSININNDYNILYNYIEYLIENKIIINNPNSDEIYNKYLYKFKCNIPSHNINTPIISYDFSYYLSIFNNKYCCHSEGCNLCRNIIYTNDIGNSINIYIQNYNTNIFKVDYSNKVLIYYGSHGTTKIFNYDYNYISTVYELEANKGSRMIKHNLTNNIPSYIKYDNEYQNELTILNYYFIEKVFIDFPLIEIYDEYEYIQKILLNIANIYDLPIIPPIKFDLRS
jgi:hypothetical protein